MNPEHPEIPFLDKAEAILNGVAGDINRAIVTKENSMKLVELNNILVKETSDEPVRNNLVVIVQR